MTKETINITTTNGTVQIERTGDKVKITQVRIAFGFKEKIVTEVIRLDDECIHHAFTTEKNLKETFKNY